MSALHVSPYILYTRTLYSIKIQNLEISESSCINTCTLVGPIISSVLYNLFNLCNWTFDKLFAIFAFKKCVDVKFIHVIVSFKFVDSVAPKLGQ